MEFVAQGVEKVEVLLELALLCKATNHAVHNKWETLWSLVLERDFQGHNASVATSQDRLSSNPQSPRSCKRLRRSLAGRNPRDIVKNLYTTMCNRTDDAHMALVAMAKSEHMPLTLKRLQTILRQGILDDNPKRKQQVTTSRSQRILINRRSPLGRTFLHACCAADYVDERVVVRCVRDLLRPSGGDDDMEGCRADPNVFTSEEYPYADRPALFFAISRVMPSVVQELINAGASLTVRVSGMFRLVSNPRQSFSGTFTPLEFACRLQQVEARMPYSTKVQEERSSKKGSGLPPYWMRKLSKCIEILRKEEEYRKVSWAG